VPGVPPPEVPVPEVPLKPVAAVEVPLVGLLLGAEFCDCAEVKEAMLVGPVNGVGEPLKFPGGSWQVAKVPGAQPSPCA